MNRQGAFLLACLVFAVASPVFSAEPITALLVKVRGSVTESAPAGGTIPLQTGSEVPAQRTVTVGKDSVAVYKLDPGIVIKEEPGTSLAFTCLTHDKANPNGPEWKVWVQLQKGDIYVAIKPFDPKVLEFKVTTSRLEATTSGGIFRVTHEFSTSTVYVTDGVVDVQWCYGYSKDAAWSKRIQVRAGEVFVVTDCEGVLRWQTELEMREMALFAALTSSAFGAGPNGFAIQLARANPPVGVLAPEIPESLPPISP